VLLEFRELSIIEASYDAPNKLSDGEIGLYCNEKSCTQYCLAESSLIETRDSGNRAAQLAKSTVFNTLYVVTELPHVDTIAW